MPSSATLPEDRNQQQRRNTTDDSDVTTDAKLEEVFEENESNLNIIDDDLLVEAQTKTIESQQKEFQHGDHHGIVQLIISIVWKLMFHSILNYEALMDIYS